VTFSSAQLVWAFALLVVLLFRPSIACQYIITPAYFYPSGSLLQYWNASEEAAPTNKILVANVDSGPGASLDTDYQSALDGATPYLTVIGYVHSAYGAAPISDVIANMSLWKSLYGIQSFFLDETDSTSASLEYYQNLTTEIRQKYHNALLVANLGTMPAVEGYVPLFDILCVFEDTYANYLTAFSSSPSWYTSYPASKFYHIVTSANKTSDLETALTLSQERNAEYVYITDSSYSRLPTYWNDEVSLLKNNCTSSAHRLTGWLHLLSFF